MKVVLKSAKKVDWTGYALGTRPHHPDALCLLAPQERAHFGGSLVVLPLFLGGRLYVRESVEEDTAIYQLTAIVPQDYSGDLLGARDRIEQIVSICANLKDSYWRSALSGINHLAQSALGLLAVPPPEPEVKPLKVRRILDL